MSIAQSYYNHSKINFIENVEEDTDIGVSQSVVMTYSQQTESSFTKHRHQGLIGKGLAQKST